MQNILYNRSSQKRHRSCKNLMYIYKCIRLEWNKDCLITLKDCNCKVSEKIIIGYLSNALVHTDMDQLRSACIGKKITYCN